MINPITADLDKQIEKQYTQAAATKGPIAAMAARYELKSKRLFGLTQKLDYETCTIVTSDGWKRNCGGAPRGALVILRLDPDAIGAEDRAKADRLILARILQQTATPVEAVEQATLFQVHRLQAPLDAITRQQFQTSCLQLGIIGTYYDSEGGISFGSDLDSYSAPFFYAAFVPSDKDLETLINASVDPARAVSIGYLRYTETPSSHPAQGIPVKIDPSDLVGSINDAQRTAVLGKTRHGKSNTVKVLAQAIFDSGLGVGQLFIDPSGEYTYYNPQDCTSLYILNRANSVRYALKARELSKPEKDLRLPAPAPLAINFYQYPDVGHQLIKTLWFSVHRQIPHYLRPILDWDPAPLNSVPSKLEDASAYNHFWRTVALYFAFLYKTEFRPRLETNLIPVDFRAEVKTELLARVTGLRTKQDGSVATEQPLAVLPEVFRIVHELWQTDKTARTKRFFPNSGANPYFNDVEDNLLRCLSGDPTIAGHKYFIPFRVYHQASGSSVFTEIVDKLLEGISVFVDVSLANEVVFQNLTEQILRELVRRQQRCFSETPDKQRTVAIYLEEAQKLFTKEQKDPNNIYNILAREGAKFNIALIYVTQSLTTISTDLTSMTDNFVVTHLDDDRETKALAHKPMFRDVASDLERIRAKGYVRMVTRSQWFVLPVQIDKFSADWAAKQTNKI